jgi:hypothetical protein
MILIIITCSFSLAFCVILKRKVETIFNNWSDEKLKTNVKQTPGKETNDIQPETDFPDFVENCEG